MFTPTNEEVAKKGYEDKDDDDKEEKVEDEGTSSTTMHCRDDKDDPTGGIWSGRPNQMIERNQAVISGQIENDDSEQSSRNGQSMGNEYDNPIVELVINRYYKFFSN